MRIKGGFKPPSLIPLEKTLQCSLKGRPLLQGLSEGFDIRGTYSKYL